MRLCPKFPNCRWLPSSSKRVCVRLKLENGFDLRYANDRQMGQFYYVQSERVDDAPGLAEQGAASHARAAETR